jgi:hypothetical protein
MGLVPKRLPNSKMGGLGEPRQPATYREELRHRRASNTSQSFASFATQATATMFNMTCNKNPLLQQPKRGISSRSPLADTMHQTYQP